MGASDWAGEMCVRLEEEFDICSERAVRLTSLIRWFSAEPGYEELRFNDERSNEWQMLKNDLPSVLREQSGDSIEARWNNFMERLGYQEIAEGDVYLIPWDMYENESHDPGVYSRPLTPKFRREYPETCKYLIKAVSEHDEQWVLDNYWQIKHLGKVMDVPEKEELPFYDSNGDNSNS